jgi:hypothetical protein
LCIRDSLWTPPWINGHDLSMMPHDSDQLIPIVYNPSISGKKPKMTSKSQGFDT